MEAVELRTALMRSARRMQKIHVKLLFPGISQGEYFALDMIDKAETAGKSGIYVSDLAKRLTVASSAVSRMLHTLEVKGLIIREVERSDRRNTCVILTDKGREARKSVAARLDAFSIRAISRMGEADTRRLIELWNKMSDIMADELKKMAKGNQHDKTI